MLGPGAGLAVVGLDSPKNVFFTVKISHQGGGNAAALGDPQRGWDGVRAQAQGCRRRAQKSKAVCLQSLLGAFGHPPEWFGEGKWGRNRGLGSGVLQVIDIPQLKLSTFTGGAGSEQPWQPMALAGQPAEAGFGIARLEGGQAKGGEGSGILSCAPQAPNSSAHGGRGSGAGASSARSSEPRDGSSSGRSSEPRDGRSRRRTSWKLSWQREQPLAAVGCTPALTWPRHAGACHRWPHP